MKELSLNILDIAQNSVKAKATLVEIYLIENAETFLLAIKDNGVGMSKDAVSRVVNPFYTTRTTREVGLGIPLLKLACEQTGGTLDIESKTVQDSKDDHGTAVRALFYRHHIDFTPLGDIISTVTTLIQGYPDIDFVFSHKTDKGTVELDTREMREVLEDVPINSFEIMQYIKEDLEEQYTQI